MNFDEIQRYVALDIHKEYVMVGGGVTAVKRDQLAHLWAKASNA